MTKIYLIQGNLASLKIVEVELIKETPEQLRVDNKSVKIVWNGGANNYTSYLSNRLNRRHQTYFYSLPEAIDDAIKSTQKSLERATENVREANLQITNLALFLQTQKEKTDAA